MNERGSLREARHVDKLLYSLGETPFYEPFERRYRPSSDFLDVVTRILPGGQWQVERQNLWYFCSPPEAKVPEQGWKIHVSAIPKEAADVLAIVTAVLSAGRVPFKFALDRSVLALMCSKSWARGSSGKFMTVYPADSAEFTALLEDLYHELHGRTGPYVLSDRRFKDCGVLYYRFGSLMSVTRLEVTGTRTQVLRSPDNTLVEDIRQPYFSPPDWIEDPLAAVAGDSGASGQPELRDGRYRVKYALAFSNAGGVYLATDNATGEDVVVKEARKASSFDAGGNDAADLLTKEHEVLTALQRTGLAPRPIDAFDEWEHRFLVEEYVGGVSPRQYMLLNSPLMRVGSGQAERASFHDRYCRIFKSLLEVVSAVHDLGITLGDLSNNNLRIDPDCCAVRLIDFEAALRMGRDDPPTRLHTPGFRDPRRPSLTDRGTDLFAVASVMLYLLFPLSVLYTLRDDLYEHVLPIIASDLGWTASPVVPAIQGLARGSLSLNEAARVLGQPTVVCAPPAGPEHDRSECEAIAQRIADFVVASMRLDQDDMLFPADPFLYRTNPVSLGFGASGVLFALRRCGREIPDRAMDWLDGRLGRAAQAELPPGLLTGASGVAWCLWELGNYDKAVEMISVANRSPLLRSHHSLYYGMAGVGMANLFFYLRTAEDHYLQQAVRLARCLEEKATVSSDGACWVRSGTVQIGYGYGQAGVALFLLRLSQVTREVGYRCCGRRALDYDLSTGIEVQPGVVSFPATQGSHTLQPYLEVGSAGIARVALRYGVGNLEGILRGLDRKYANFAGVLYGLGSFVEALVDAHIYDGGSAHLQGAMRPIAGLRDLFLMERGAGLAPAGDGHLKVSCDYATGAAGLARTLSRASRLDGADFTLDELDRDWVR